LDYYLPSYSPDLNPIEMAFSKLKAVLRKAAERTIPGRIRLIGRLLKKFSPEEQEFSEPRWLRLLTNMTGIRMALSGPEIKPPALPEDTYFANEGGAVK
jgi:hypothetical protein